MSCRNTYSKRAVAFLDVLGFQNKLQEFENEAFDYYNNNTNISNSEDGLNFSSDENLGPIFYSKKANDFIEIFNSVISKLDTEKFSYYLFSDNICITVECINSNEDNTLIEILLVISELYFEFIQKGYFLRGGIDYGLFIDNSSIAVGVPLATAYNMESTLAVYPRIVISENFLHQLKDDSEQDYNGYSSALASTLIKSSCEIYYLNVFNHIFKVENKETFFEKYSEIISHNLILTKTKENLFVKYRWIADEFNFFIDSYVTHLAFLDENFYVTNEFIDTITNLKIDYGH